MERDGFVFYRSFYEGIKDLPRDIQGDVLTAIMEYGLNGVTTDNLKPVARAIFTLIKPQIDANNQKFMNGKSGGRPPKEKPNHNQEETKQKPNRNQTETKPEPKENVKEKEKVKEESKSNTPFIPQGEKQENLFQEEHLNFSIPVNSESEEKEKSSAKKEKENPPDLNTFMQWAKEIYQNELKIDFTPFSFAVESKYNTWKDSGWKDGYGKPIKGYKNKLRNAIPHLKAINNFNNNGSSQARRR
ncbi:DUF6291 domain-containing protein [Chryseobacterium sp. T16E-39]|uniref:DUF6291 domain-containing protein n=1 Tax=Chryseobacterium sp. T16E-39 TaxID=2015076 RepID=UPI0016210B6D|nr:DUF6291 domain-containing protein [Chryseobacterium sp. T16E-39]